jgi:hypothetical protein
LHKYNIVLSFVKASHRSIPETLSTKNNANEENDEDWRADMEKVNSMFSFPSTSEPLTDHVQAALYYLAGKLVTNNDCPSIQKLSLFTKLKAFKENMLVFPSVAFYNHIYNCELDFRVNENSFCSNTLNIEHFVNICVTKSKLNVPNCHNIVEKVTVFFLM